MMLQPCGGVAVDAVDYNVWQWVMWLEDFEEGSELEKVRTARTPSCAGVHHICSYSQTQQPQPQRSSYSL